MNTRLPIGAATGLLLLLASACNSPGNKSAAGNATPGNDALPVPISNDANVADNVTAAALPLHERDAAGAGRVVERAIALAMSGRFEAVRPLVHSGADIDRQIARAQRAYNDHPDARVEITGPGISEGAAGSIYMEVPLAVTFAGPDGKAVRRAGTVTLRRVNDVPGATEEQLSWRIVDAKLYPAGK